MINDVSREQSICENVRQLLIENYLKQSKINEILKDSTINNKIFLINNILNKKITNKNIYVENLEKLKCVLNLKKQC